jgi:two-component system cell cycle sensor histidine kinase/response regulator CckA
MGDGTPPPGLLDRLLAPEGGPWRDLFEAGPWGAALLDPQGRIVLANAALATLAGVEGRARLIGFDFTLLFAPAQRRELGNALARALAATADATGGTGATVTADLPATPGSELPVAAMVAFTPIRGAAGKGVEGAVARVVDVSAQRWLEQQLAQAQKMHAIGQLAAGIAHDFRSLLTAIGLTVDEVTTHLQVDAGVAAELSQIRRSTERGEALVSKLLAFARKQPMQPRVVVLNEAIEELSMLLRRLLGGPVSLILDLDPPRRAVRVDPTQFDQVIINLAVNARDAMPRGGRLTLRTGQVNLFRPLIRGRETIPPGRYAMVEVEDTGTGIPESHLERIFEPFFTTKGPSGTGLGLSTVWGIVRQMEGFVAVDSTPGEGTIFRVYLPRVDGLEEPEARGPAPVPVIAEPPREWPKAAADPSRGTVLIAEDEDAIRRLAARALAREGWEVVQAGCGDEAIAAIAGREAPLAALVTDMVMPGADGEAVVRAARARWPELPVIVTSGYAESLGGEGLGRLNVAWLAKPYSMRDLGRATARLVGTVAQDAGRGAR